MVGNDLVTGKARDQGKQRRKAKNGKVKVKFGDLFNTLFDVSTEVPEIEEEFYEDQKTNRKLKIGKVDRKVTETLNKEALKQADEDAQSALVAERKAEKV